MVLKLKEKKAIVAEVAEQASSAMSAVVADYRGLTVNQMSDLRNQARESAVYVKVVRNNLAKIAVKGTDFECMTDAFRGPLILAFSKEEPGAAAKLFKSFGKGNTAFKVKSLSMGGELFGAEKLEEFSNLPSWNDALSLLCNVLQAPIRNFVRTTNEIPANIVRVLAAVHNVK